MLREVLTVSALILAILLVRAIFKNRVPKRMVYTLWLVVLVKLCLPGTLVSLPVLPAEEAAAPVQRVELPAQPLPAQQPAQAATQPQMPVQQPISPVQEAAEAPAKPLTAMQIFQIVWAGGSALLGLWLFGTWLVFTVRLHKSRRFLGRHGRTRIYTSSAVKSPCLAGLIPAVYLTEDVLQTDSTELILRHELTHLRHLDHLWSFCRTAAVIAYWWNPFIWLAAICSKRDAELACDEAVAAGLSDAQRLVYARAILAQAPRKAAALSLAGPPVRERILFLTKKQRTSVLCVILALLLIISAAGCSLTELTRQKSGEITLPEETEPVQQEPLKTAMPLTQAQIDAVNAVFADYELSTDDTLGHFAVNGFFTSTYDDVRELNLNNFLTYFGECGGHDISEEEFAQLNAKWEFRVDSVADFPLPIHRYPASAVEGVLRRFAGIGLACAGVILQSVMNNSLASPNTIGVNSGSGFAVMLAMVFFPANSFYIPVFAFLGALATTVAIFLLAAASDSSRTTIILAGITVSSFLNAGINTIKLLDTDITINLTSFLIGTLSGLTLQRITLPCICILVAFLLSLFFAKPLNLLSLGDDIAHSLGLRVPLTRFLLLVSASVLAGCVVSYAGL